MDEESLAAVTEAAGGSSSGRKIHYGHVLAAALDLTRLPSPLDGVLSRA